MLTKLADWLDELGRRHPPHIMRFGLERMHHAMARTGIEPPNPQHTRIVTIAGTNGKGSVAMLLARLLMRAGVSNGLYLSPHIYTFRERLQVDGQMIEATAWVDAFNLIDANCAELELTFFEWVTLAAFILLHRASPQVWILEVGLGGRLDAVNALDNQLNLITSIGLDHTDRLGNTPEAIATEKAGVMRSGVTTICGSPLAIFPSLAQQTRARLQQIGCAWDVVSENDNITLRASDWQFRVPLPPGVLAANLAMALLAARELAILPSKASSLAWLANETLPCRQQQLRWGGVECLIDVAHNQEGIETLSRRVMRDFAQVPVVAIFGCLQDKVPPSNLASFFPNVHTWVVAELFGERSQSVASIVKRTGLIQARPLAGLSGEALQSLVGNGLLLVFGSFHLPPLIRRLLEADDDLTD